MKVAMSYLH
jgi:hypothetical protein